ncbi:hypothetical protein G6F35_014660 [Rhizopus arrhizus]|nr:hypothetical protein G6F35_014660 [Rhizopus arrhizus]
MASGPCVRADRRLTLQLENSMSRLPSLYISHGSPMTALHPGQVGVRLAELAQDLPTPRAIVMASAHWLGRQPLVGAHPQPPTIHDFGGFPRALFELQYPAPGDPALAEEVADRIAAAGLPVALDPQRGLDHGAWVPLRLLRPQADIPVVPVSIQPLLGPEHQFALGRALAPLREQGVLLVGSGSITHNLHDWGDYQDGKEAPYAGAVRRPRAPDRRAPVAAVLRDGRGGRGRLRCPAHRCWYRCRIPGHGPVSLRRGLGRR